MTYVVPATRQHELSGVFSRELVPEADRVEQNIGGTHEGEFHHLAPAHPAELGDFPRIGAELAFRRAAEEIPLMEVDAAPARVGEDLAVKIQARVHKSQSRLLFHLAQNGGCWFLSRAKVSGKDIPEVRPLPLVQKKKLSVPFDERADRPVLQAARRILGPHSPIEDQGTGFQAAARSTVVGDDAARSVRRRVARRAPQAICPRQEHACQHS